MCRGQKVHIMCTGALTNVAVLLILFPEVLACIEQIVLMGGAIGSGNTNPCAEFNMQVRHTLQISVDSFKACFHRQYFLEKGPPLLYEAFEDHIS